VHERDLVMDACQTRTNWWVHGAAPDWGEEDVDAALWLVLWINLQVHPKKRYVRHCFFALDLLTNEVIIEFDMLSLCLEQWIGRKKEGRDVIKIEDWCGGKRNRDFLEEPWYFRGRGAKKTIFSFTRGASDSCLALGGPRNRVGAKIVTSGGLASGTVACPIKITVCSKGARAFGVDATLSELVPLR